MKYLRVTATFEPDRIPPLYADVGDGSPISELRVVDWNLAATDRTTLLYAIDGDAEQFRDGAGGTDGVERVTLSEGPGPTAYALVDVRPGAIPLFDAVVTAMASAGAVVRPPLVYRDGRSTGHVVGTPGPLQALVDEAGPGIDVRIDEIGRFPGQRAEPAATLSDRQREAVLAALSAGYYEQPRGATHQDVARELGCAPNTASEHLQKAEAKLVRAGMADEVGRDA